MACVTQGVWKLEQRLEAVLAAQPLRRVRSVLPTAGCLQRDSASDPVLRQHDGAGTRLGRWGKRGQQSQALGRSRGVRRGDQDENPASIRMRIPMGVVRREGVARP